jgi:hypothetical protein
MFRIIWPRKYPEIVNNSYPSHRYFDSEIVPVGGEFDKKKLNACGFACPLGGRGWWKQMIGGA